VPTGTPAIAPARQDRQAWHSQVRIGLAALNWVHGGGGDDLHEIQSQARRIVTPEQRSLQLHDRWVKRDLALLQGAGPNACTHASGPTGPRLSHTLALRRAGDRVTRGAQWDPDEDSQEVER